MNDLVDMLKRQAEWQKKRAELTWPEKMRMVEAIRDSIRQLRASGGTDTEEAPSGRRRGRHRRRSNH